MSLGVTALAVLGMAAVLVYGIAIVYNIASANARYRERERREREAWERLERGLAAGNAAKGREPDDVLRENDGRWK